MANSGELSVCCGERELATPGMRGGQNGDSRPLLGAVILGV